MDINIQFLKKQYPHFEIDTIIYIYEKNNNSIEHTINVLNSIPRPDPCYKISCFWCFKSCRKNQ